MKMGVKLFAIFLLFSVFGMAEVTRYDGTLSIDPAAETLRADLVVTVKAPKKGLAQEVFYLNKALRIESVKCRQCSGYKFDVTRTGQLQFVEHGVPLTVTFKRPLQPGEQAAIRMRYSGSIVPDRFGTNFITAKWTELGMYSGWYPYQQEFSSTYRFDLRVKVRDRAYKVTGDGDVSGGPGNWRLVENEPTMDMIVVTSPDLKTRKLERGGMRLRIDASGVPDAAVEQFASDAADMVAHYNAWFGPVDLREATFVMNPRVSGGGYARPRFMSLPYSPDQLPWLGHEIAHFWWSGAPAESWEDWLNESFAEYTSARYLREVKGEKEYAARLQTARERSAGQPPIWGIARSNEHAHDVLYDKGMLRLAALEEMIGKEKFTSFLATLHREKIKNTEAVLQTLEKQTSPEMRQKFEAMLKE
jgi:Peptidase family M1 domain